MHRTGKAMIFLTQELDTDTCLDIVHSGTGCLLPSAHSELGFGWLEKAMTLQMQQSQSPAFKNHKFTQMFN